MTYLHNEDEDGHLSMVKGGPLTLLKGKRIRNELRVQLSWEMQPDSEDDVDLDLSAFLVTKEGKVPNGEQYYCVYYNNHRSVDGSCWHHASQRHGGGVGDDLEAIDVHLRDVGPDVEKIVFVVSIYDGDVLGHTFGKLASAHVTFLSNIVGGGDDFVNIETDNLDTHFRDATCVVVGEIYKTMRGWQYRPIAQPYASMVEAGHMHGIDFRE